MTDQRELYGLPLDRFVAERAALAKSLRSEGQREQADQVAKRRKPSVAAWAVNQLVRTQRGKQHVAMNGERLVGGYTELAELDVVMTEGAQRFVGACA